jgi:MFS transporter, DHA2 family, multidrug resistance protein
MSSPDNKWLVAASVTFGALMAAVDTSILYVATPHLQGVFSATVEEISWASTSYLIAAVLTTPLVGWLCSHYGRKTVCQSGLLIFILGSVACGMASNLHFLIAARLIQGFGAGILLPVEQVILRQAFPAKEQGFAMGVYGVTIMFGPALGPLIGGLIIDNAQWQLLFLVNVPLGIIGFLMVRRFVNDPEVQQPSPASPPGGRINIDWLGILYLASAVFSLLWLLDRGERHDWFETTSNCVLLFISIATFIMFCVHEWVTPKPAVDLKILVNPGLSSGISMTFLLSLIVAASLFVLPIYMQEVLHFSATQAGIALMPRAITMMVCFPIAGYFFSKVSPRLMTCIGISIGIYSAWLMTNFSHQTGMSDIIFPQVLQGIAIVCMLTPLSTLVLMHAPKENLAAAAGLNGFARQLGSSMGIAIFATLLSHFELVVRGEFIHKINWSFPLLRERFTTVIQFFYIRTPVGESTALQQALSRLNMNVDVQVQAMSYVKIFEWITVLFICFVFFIFLVKPVNLNPGVK